MSKSHSFKHYQGLIYNNNVDEMIKIHELMEKAGYQVSASTKDKFSAYSDKRPFKVNYFISKVGKTIKWCPTNSAEKLAKIESKPYEWWLEQLSDDIKIVPSVNIPTNWLEEQAMFYHKYKIKQMTSMVKQEDTSAMPIIEDIITESVEALVEYDDHELPF